MLSHVLDAHNPRHQIMVTNSQPFQTWRIQLAKDYTPLSLNDSRIIVRIGSGGAT